MYLTGEQKRLALQMARDNGVVDTSCPYCSEEMTPIEAEEVFSGIKGRVFMSCENEHESHFFISYEQAERLGLHRAREDPETSGTRA